jgi:hypothetical protein
MTTNGGTLDDVDSDWPDRAVPCPAPAVPEIPAATADPQASSPAASTAVRRRGIRLMRPIMTEFGSNFVPPQVGRRFLFRRPLRTWVTQPSREPRIAITANTGVNFDHAEWHPPAAVSIGVPGDDAAAQGTCPPSLQETGKEFSACPGNSV